MLAGLGIAEDAVIVPLTFRRVLIASGASGLFAAVSWLAWLGWDHQYFYVDGVAQGPYRAWQVVGCGATVVAGAVAAHLWARHPSAVPVIAVATVVGFAIPWTMNASSDETGLWLVGLFMIVVGGGLGLAAALAVTAAITKAFDRLS
jgi:hypothetical protein